MRILFNVHAGSCPCYVISIVVSSHGLCTYTHVFMMLLSMLLLIKAAHVHSLFSFPARLAAQRARALWACACLLICQVHVQVRVHHSDLICSDDSGNSSAAGFGRFCGWLSARPFSPPIYRFQKYTFPGVFLRKWLFRRGFVEESPLQEAMWSLVEIECILCSRIQSQQHGRLSTLSRSHHVSALLWLWRSCRIVGKAASRSLAVGRCSGMATSLYRSTWFRNHRVVFWLKE